MPPKSEGKEAQSRTRGALSHRIDGTPPRRVPWWSGALLVLCVGLGWYLVETLGRYGEGIERRALLATVSSSAAMFKDEMGEIRGLTGAAADLGGEGYKKIREEVVDIRQSVLGSRFAYLVALKDGNVIFIADSEPANSPDYSPPGQVYDEATDVLRGVFMT